VENCILIQIKPSYTCPWKSYNKSMGCNITSSLEQSPSSETNNNLASQEISRLSRNPKVHYRVHKSTLLVPILSKLKVKLSLCLTKHHAMKTYWGSRGIAPGILDLGTRWRWVVSFAPWPLYPQGKSPSYTLDRRLGGLQSRSGRGGEEKNSPAPRHEDVFGEWRYSSTHSLTSARDRDEWSVSRPDRFTPREKAPGTHCLGGWVGPRAVLDAVVKRKIPSPRRKSNPRNPIVQPITQHYTDWANTALQKNEIKDNKYLKHKESVLCVTLI
jgi:hypothetical protein